MIHSVDAQNILMIDDLLNKELFDQHVTSQKTYQVYSDVDEPTPTLDEVENAIQKFKDHKAPGIDLIQAELIKKASSEPINVKNAV